MPDVNDFVSVNEPIRIPGKQAFGDKALCFVLGPFPQPLFLLFVFLFPILKHLSTYAFYSTTVGLLLMLGRTSVK